MNERRLCCAWCLKFFDWTPRQASDPAPLYCSKTHKNAASKANARMLTHMKPGKCPTPDKRAFDNSQAARRWMLTFPEVSGGTRPYRCACGKFHLGRVKRHVHAKGFGERWTDDERLARRESRHARG